ncbi:MAG: RagB/SusD family nutrient uptake outer membrane protein [Prevotella sp.]|nr:RagB/SusD family nutrient uptake outer membrane protein [Prevotella sp.]
MKNKKIYTRMISLSFIICLLSFSVALTSCLEHSILPDDKVVEENFWKTKEDVQSMVTAAYAAMASEPVITRLIIWGDFRSDELVGNTEKLSGSIPDALKEIEAVSIQTTNQFATWSDFYDVINKCNIVLEKAEKVLYEDPNYTQSDYESHCCQMLALRSLCYFYLVRNFRDVPYYEYAHTTSSQVKELRQSAPATVLESIIQTLEQVASNSNCPRSNNFAVSEWRRVGWFTLDGVKALLADVYLWRASVMHTSADYQRCVELCDQIIESKRSQHVKGRNETEEKPYPLTDNNNFTDAYSALYVTQNAEESIFELQSRNNAALCKYYYKYGDNNSTEGYLKASGIFANSTDADANLGNAKVNANTVFSTSDLRFYSSHFTAADASFYDVRKMVSQQEIRRKTGEARTQSRTFANYDQNYIVYRLPDVMLMKAEALVQQMQDTIAGSSDEQKTAVMEANAELRKQAFDLVEAVNTRSCYADDRANYALDVAWQKGNRYKDFSKVQMETLVMEERLRELCFEGKRWYDLMRYNYRHIEGVRYNETYGQMIAAAGSTELELPALYKDMLELMTRSLSEDRLAVQAKMHNESYLYMPIPENDINLCDQLVQNPAYKSINAYEKTY